MAFSFFACSDDDSSSLPPSPDGYYLEGKKKINGNSYNFKLVADSLHNRVYFSYSDSTRAKNDPSAYSPTFPICNEDRVGWMAYYGTPPMNLELALCCPVEWDYKWKFPEGTNKFPYPDDTSLDNCKIFKK